MRRLISVVESLEWANLWRFCTMIAIYTASSSISSSNESIRHELWKIQFELSKLKK